MRSISLIDLTCSNLDTCITPPPKCQTTLPQPAKQMSAQTTEAQILKLYTIYLTIVKDCQEKKLSV
jgi:hypothetical protein